MERQMVVTQQDCPARLVPAGTKISIPKDTFVTITQALGGNYTVSVNGNLARIDGTDAGAIGMKAQAFDFKAPEDGSIDDDQVWQALKTIFDPEIPVNLVDLGLIYSVKIDQSTHVVDIDMTLTAPGCGMGPVLLSDVKYRVAKVPNVKQVNVELVFDPPWDRDKMSDEAKLETGLFF
ncbi:putative Fe-S cluster assembly protein SufT [Pleionea mediterranea]|uniref:Putative FeS assembly SUF system protein SufT n=1 Tax=Pleionea mediterranea TaxID=523701 RepID=A0A316FM99_9GAMM|nr:putative Fe-S cluster assembly protein SufT [Pleionea mediterranea]PWK50011.1 putative FeS assembly SUF system protein SufT [Pleionea mediterranea]